MVKPVALLCSDLHLSHTPPAARSAEPDWYAAQKRVLDEVKDWNLPVLCAGDIFDRWNSPAELINFALECLPDGMICIPGQHDLPNHRLDEIQRSAYWTLVKAGKIKNLYYHEWYEAGDFRAVLHPYPWSVDVEPTEKSSTFKIAIIHAYIWKSGYSYPGADENKHVIKYQMERLAGYDVAVFGDNHKSFLDGNVFNCGTMMRRKIDEMDYRPNVGILHDDGSIKLHYLDTSKDQFIDVDEPKQVLADTREFIRELKLLDQDSLDFREAVHRFLDQQDVSPGVRGAVVECLG